MASLQIQAKLIEDVYLHQAVNSDGDVAVAENAAGLQEMFTIGTDGRLFNIAPSPESDTGWAETDLRCPGRADVIAAIARPDGRIVVAAANQSTMQVFVLAESSGPRWDPAGWKIIAPGPDIVAQLTFYDLQLRIDGRGEVEFLLLYFHRMFSPQWQYTYRVGRALVTAATWGIGFNIDALYSGPNPVHLPAMAIGRSGGLPTLFLYWREAEKMRVWKGIDGAPEVSNVTLPDATDFMRRLFALGDGADSELYAAGLIHPAGVNGLYRFDWTQRAFALLSGGADVVDAEGAFGATTGYDVMAVGSTGTLYHIHGSPDGTTWTPFTAMGSRATSVVGSVTDAEGPVFIVATVDSTLARYYRHPQTLDWERTEVAIQTSVGEQVVWYTTHVAALDARQRAIPACTLTLSCIETTQLVLNGRTEIIGPDRPLEVQTDPSGTLTIQQSTAELANLYVPELTVALQTGESATTHPALEVNDRLYNLTGAELRDAKGRGGSPVLPPDQQGHADEIAGRIATAMSLGRAPHGPMVTWDSLGLPESSRGRAVVAGQEVDVGDLFESIKDAVLQVTDITVTAVGQSIVEGLSIVIHTASGVLQVFVTSLEQAFDVVRTVFESVGAAFETVLEWLGMLFDWQAIKAKAAEVARIVEHGLGVIPALMQQAGLPGSLDATFAEFQRQSTDAFAYIRRQVGAPSLDDDATTAGFTNPGDAFTFGGQNVTLAANWLMDRVRPHLARASLPVNFGPGWAGIEAMLPSLDGAQSGATRTITDNLTNLFSLLPPGDVLTASIDRLFDQFEALSSALLDFVKTIVRAGVDAIATLCSSNALRDLFTTPITIPVVSDLLETVGLGGETSLLDILSLLIAVPLHVIDTVIHDAAPAAVEKAVYLVCAVAFFITGVLSAINDALSSALKPIAMIAAAVWVVILGVVFYGYDQSDPKPPEVLIAGLAYLAFQAMTFLVSWKSLGEPTATRRMAIYAIVDAAFLNVVAGIWALRTSFTPNPPKAWQLVANHVGTLPDIFRWPDLVWAPPAPKPVPARLMVVAVDVVGYGALMAGAIGDYLASPAPDGSVRRVRSAGA